MEDKKIARRYEEISRALEKVLGDPNELLHILLLNLGRKFCRPKRPKCEECPIKSECNKQL